MKKMLALVGGFCLATTLAAAQTTTHPGRVNIANSENLVVQGGNLLVHVAGNAGEIFILTPAGIQIRRPGASYIDNMTVGASTRFRTSGSASRDTLNLILEPDGDAVFGRDIEAARDVIVGNTVSTGVLEIRGSGNDLAESFKVNNPIEAVKAGMVVSIDPKNPGEMKLASTAYDRKVAGIINGAGGLHAGIHLGDTYKADSGYHQVALTGRVYVKVAPTSATVQPGDMLTTSAVPGHAMKVTDYTKAQGAVIGKAMGTVDPETGLVLVLVSLQ